MQRTTHYPAMLAGLAVLYCLIFTLPHAIVSTGTPTSSTAAFSHPVADDLIYGAFYHDVQEGDFRLADSASYEHRDERMPWPALTFWLVGGLARLLGSLDTAIIVLVAVFSLAIFLVQYKFVYLLTKNRLVTLLSIFLLPISYVFMTAPRRMLEFLLHFPLTTMFIIESPVRRRLELFVFFLALTLLYLAYTKRDRWLALGAGVAIGALSQLLIYYYAFLMAGTGLLMAYHWLRKERTEAKTLLIVLGAGLAVALPYVIGSLLFKRLPGHADALARLGLQHGRSALTLLPSAAFIAFLFVFNKLLRKHHGAPVRFLNAFFIGNLILYNQHIITGVQLQTWHWLTQTGRPWLVLMLLFLAATLLFRKEARWTRGAFIALIALAAAWSLWANAGVAMHLAPAYSVDRPYAEAFAWLDANTPPDSVVLSPDATISTNIPVRTHNTAYVPNGFDTAAPNCELIYRWIAALKLFNASRERVEQLLAANATSMLNPISFMFHVGPSPSPQTLAAIYGTTDFWPYDIAQYQIDYIIVGEKERSLGTLTTDIPTERIYSEDGVDIYRVNLGKPERPSPLQERLCGQETI